MTFPLWLTVAIGIAALDIGVLFGAWWAARDMRSASQDWNDDPRGEKRAKK